MPQKLGSRKKTGKRTGKIAPPITEVLYGVHPVSEALKAGRREIREIFLSRIQSRGNLPPRIETLLEMADSGGIPIRQVDDSQLEKQSGSEFHQGIGARVSGFPLNPLKDLIAPPESGSPFLLLIDSVVDTHNLGALIRTALCVGVDGIIIPKDRAASPTPAVSKASAGALEHARIAQVTNMAVTLQQLKKKRIWISGADHGATTPVFDADLAGPLGIVVGGEEKGIRPLVKKECDFMISIPQEGPLDSLNASVAGAVILYEAYRQRRYSDRKMI